METTGDIEQAAERAQAFLDRGEPYGIMHLSVTAEELARDVLAMAAILAETELRPSREFAQMLADSNRGNARRADELARWNAELESVAHKSRRALVEIAEDCDHDRPSVAKIADYARAALTDEHLRPCDQLPWLEDKLYPRCPTCDQTMVAAETQALAKRNAKVQRGRMTEDE